MAKKSSRTERRMTTVGRDTNRLSPRYVPRPLRINVRTELAMLARLEDRRAYRPDIRVAPPRAVRRAATRIEARGKKFERLKFGEPRAVSLCSKRQTRSRVLHAFKIAGKRGVGKGKKRRTNNYSQIGC